jgi:thiamine transport system permease protein
MKQSHLSIWGARLLVLLPTLFFLLFFFYPLGSIFDVSLRPDGQWDLSGFVRIASTAYYRDTLFFTIWQAFLSTLLTLLFAIPSAYIFARYDFIGKGFWLSFATLPFVLPTVVVAMAFSSLLGSRGLVNQVFMTTFGLENAPLNLQNTLTMILIAHIFYNYAVALRMIAGYWMSISQQYEDSARILGANSWRLWRYVYFPMLMPAITAAGILVFMFTFTSFGVVLILGGIRFATLEVQIYYQALNVFDLPLAAALSLVQIMFMFLMMWVYTRLQSRIASHAQAQVALKHPKNGREKAIVYGTLGIMGLLVFSPLFSLVLRAFDFTKDLPWYYFARIFDNNTQSILFVPPSRAIINSLAFASMTTILGVILGTILAYIITRLHTRWRGLVDSLAMLPLATSAVTLGFGYIIALDEPPLNLRSSWILIVFAHTLIAVPFVVRSVLPALRSIPKNLSEAGRILGARPWQIIWWIERPLIARAMTVGAVFAFTVSMGEFGASLFVARPDTPTLPIAIFRYLGQPGSDNYGQAVALSTILMAVCFVGFLLIERFRTEGVGEF